MLHTRAAPELLAALYSLDPVPENAPVFQGCSYEPLVEKSPYVFILDNPRHPFYERMCPHKEDRGFLMHTCTDIPALHAHWRSLLTVRMPDGTGSHFRFYSARVMAPLIPSCSRDELVALLGPCRALFIPMEDGMWLHVRNPLAADEPDRPMPVLPPPEGVWWQVRPEHLAAFAGVLERIYRENIVDRIWEEYTSLADEVELVHGSVEAFVYDTLSVAEGYGFSQPGDVFSFILLCLHYDWHRTPGPEHLRALRVAGTDADTALLLLERTLRSPHDGR